MDTATQKDWIDGFLDSWIDGFGNRGKEPEADEEAEKADQGHGARRRNFTKTLPFLYRFCAAVKLYRSLTRNLTTASFSPSAGDDQR